MLLERKRFRVDHLVVIDVVRIESHDPVPDSFALFDYKCTFLNTLGVCLSWVRCELLRYFNQEHREVLDLTMDDPEGLHLVLAVYLVRFVILKGLYIFAVCFRIHHHQKVFKVHAR
jgi:hypothetical protein